MRTGKPINGEPQPRWIVGPAAHFNVDSMGYNADVIQKQPNQVSWGKLLNTTWKGRVSLLRDPGIMSQDGALAVSALGLLKVKDNGNMSRAEIDRLFKILTRYKKQGQFRAFWSAYTDSVNLMVSKEVVIESMWSSALVKAAGVNVLYAAPPEGFRGWCSAEGISSKVTDPAKLQACYDYINWNYNGFLGAVIMRQGYYIANGTKLLPWIKSESRGSPLVSPRPSSTTGGAARRLPRPARHHRQGRRHQEGRAPRRRWSSSASAVRLLELVSRRERLPREDRERLPHRLAGLHVGSGGRIGGGGIRRPPVRSVGARSHRADQGLSRRDGRRRRRQPARRPRRIRRPAGTVRLRKDHDAADDRRARFPTEGDILLDGESLVDLPPHKRPTTTVFQHFALFPHRTTLQNVEFGLKMHGVGKEERRETAIEALEMVGLVPLADRKPAPSRAGSSSASPSPGSS